MVIKKVPPKTREQKLEERRAELDWYAQMQAAHEAERAEKQKEHEAFAARARAGQAAIDTHIRRSWAQRLDEPLSEAQFNALRGQIEQEAYAQIKVEIPSLNQLFAEQAEADRLAKEAEEQARLAAITPRENWFATLSWPERQRVEAYERIRKTPWPGSPQ